MEPKYAVYAIVIEDTNEAFERLADATAGDYRLIESDIEQFDVAASIVQDLVIL